MKNREINLYICRTIAILSICFNHALNTYFDATNYLFWQNSLLSTKLFILIGYVLSRYGVPLFLMISGAILLNRKYETKDDLKKFYKNNLLSLVITVCIWNIIYYLFSILYWNHSFSIRELLYILLFMKESPMPHMWYMPMIIGLYIFVPFISTIVKKFSFKELIIPITFVFVSFFLLPNIASFIKFYGYSAVNIKTIISKSFSGGEYGLYLILGYYIYNKNLLNKIKNNYLWVIIIFNFLLCILFQANGYMHSSKYMLYYNSMFLLLSSIGIFELIRKNKNINKNKKLKVFEVISISSLGIYFAHRPILFVLGDKLVLNASSELMVIIVFIISIVLSLLMCLVLSKNKYSKKYILRTR